MANPTKPKDIKPKTEEEEIEKKKIELPKFNINIASILPNVIITAVVCICFIAANYFIQNTLLSSKLKNISAEAPADGEEGADAAAEGEGEEEATEKGIILDLGEFILNLSDANARRYLKVSVAIELTKKPEDAELEKASEGGGEGGGHGEGKAPADPMKAIEVEMDQYRPAIRDSIISVLSSKTSEELFTVPGKELAKEQIKEAVDAIFDGDREVIRVSFGNFFIQ